MQLRLSKRIVFEDRLPERIRCVGGVDVAYTKDTAIGAAVVLDYDSLELVESQTSCCKIRFPYIPTLLSFREIRPALLSIKKLKIEPDVFLVDGQGFAHPYRCGFACHLGLLIDRPTIGIAKSRLFGEIDRVWSQEGVALLKHEGEVIGAVIGGKDVARPVFVSVGHRVSLETAVGIVKHCIRGHRVPEPILKAHEAANVEKRKINIDQTTNRFKV
jgi:deoxyribonuclease V